MMETLAMAEDGIARIDGMKQTGEDMFYMYGSTAGHTTEETDYIRKIRSTLEKIHNQLFKDDINGNTINSKNDTHNSPDGNSFDSRYKQIFEKLQDNDYSLAEAFKENEHLQIKLEASREAGSGAIREATRRLYENYSKKSAELRKRTKEEHEVIQHAWELSRFGPETPGVTAQLHQGCTSNRHQLEAKLNGRTKDLYASVTEYQETFKKSVVKLNDVAEKIEEKHGRILALENLMKRMEDEKASLLEKKWVLESEISRRMASPGNLNGCLDMQTKVSTTEEQITHLQQLMMLQHQSLRNLIQEREDLKNRLQEQDDTIEHLKERINTLECQNKEMKCKVEQTSNPSRLKVSKGVLVKESMLSSKSPYFMLRNIKLLKESERT
uniref:Uncharacterized protein n=1 Tax=Leptobrachium leishanense TaxID=445787 RepID=A0A8C5LZW1_9ANUR